MATTPTMTEEQIKNSFGNQYAAAKNAGDWQLMEKLNREANKARGLGDIVTATVDISAIRDKFGTPAPTAAAPVYTPEAPALRSAADLSALYGGITYDEAAIRSKFDAATAAQYEALKKEYAATENKFYDKLYGTGMTALDTIRKSNAAAVATGASRGMQAANELSAVLGLEQEGVAGATDLAQQRNLLMDKEQAAYAKNALDALNTSNQTKLSLGNLGANVYAADTQFNVGMMDYYARLDQAAKNLAGMGLQADAARYGADQSLAGVIGAANTNKASSEYTANKNYDAAVYAADKNNAAQTAYYEWMKKNGGGSGGGGSTSSGFPYTSPAEAVAAGDKPGFMMFFPNLGLEDATKLWNELLKKSQTPDAISGAAPGTNINIPKLPFNRPGKM